jgi:hypothetical protein
MRANKNYTMPFFLATVSLKKQKADILSNIRFDDIVSYKKKKLVIFSSLQLSLLFSLQLS